MDVFVYTLIALALWLVIVFRDLEKDWKNHVILIFIGLFLAFLMENLLVEFGILNHKLPFKIWNMPLVIFIWYIFYVSAVYSLSKLKDGKKISYAKVFMYGAIIGFLFDVTSVNLGYYSYPCETMFPTLNNLISSPRIFEIPWSTPLSEGAFFSILLYLGVNLKERLNKK